METINQETPEEEIKRGRKKGQKARPVLAVNRQTFDFFGIFPSSGQAAFVLFENRDMGQNISKCAKGESRRVKEYIFEFVDITEGITSNLINETVKKAKKRYLRNEAVTFSPNMVKKMGDGDYNMLTALYDKYKD